MHTYSIPIPSWKPITMNCEVNHYTSCAFQCKYNVNYDMIGKVKHFEVILFHSPRIPSITDIHWALVDPFLIFFCPSETMIPRCESLLSMSWFMSQKGPTDLDIITLFRSDLWQTQHLHLVTASGRSQAIIQDTDSMFFLALALVCCLSASTFFTVSVWM